MFLLLPFPQLGPSESLASNSSGIQLCFFPGEQLIEE